MRVAEIVAPEQVGKKYYVYVHKYPKGFINEDRTDLSGIVFYVGKGSGYRIYVHECEARTGHPSRKCDVIRAIWNQGLQVDKVKLYETDIDLDACVYEWALINIVYASEHLTNIANNGYQWVEIQEAKIEAAKELEEKKSHRIIAKPHLSPCVRSMVEGETCYSLRDAAGYVHSTKNTVHKRAMEGLLIQYRDESTGEIFYSKSELDELTRIRSEDESIEWMWSKYTEREET